jgi:hypothetical protein
MAAVTCIGESHMACVLVAAEEARIALNAIPLKRKAVTREFLRAGGTPAREDSLYENASRGLPKNALRGVVCSFIGGRYPLALGLRRHPRPFDFVLATQPELPVESGTELIPLNAMRQLLSRDRTKRLDLLEQVVRAAAGPVYQFESPPPCRDDRPANGVASGYLRYKVWRLHSDVVREHAERIGAHYVPRPDEAVDEEGFLKPQFALTMTHANSAYGAMVLDQIAAAR